MWPVGNIEILHVLALLPNDLGGGVSIRRNGCMKLLLANCQTTDLAFPPFFAC